ncbi:Signal transduction histidine kinase [Thermostaphylospora chromogena]|uniref:Sensor-like histidine kinase SenX3 n=2 Tax=Thermostaphylospora chromogena TaxID=35622 RepID=A0A1H1AUQ3_9ACTN|nr:Signal transduction histidine kinase [Thermostaphylospora chromogena]
MMDSVVDYEAVFAVLPVPFAVLTPDLTVVAVNNAYLEATNRTRADLLGRSIFTAFPANPAALEDPHAWGVEPLRASLERVVATGKPDTMPLVRNDIRTSDIPGTFQERYWSMINTPVLGPDGEVKLIVHRSQDVTRLLEQMRLIRGERGGAMESQIYAHVGELLDLNDRLKRAYREEQQTVSALHEAIEEQQRFLFDASHDLRNPIAGLLAEVEDALSDPQADPWRTLRTLHSNIERLNDIVADLLVLARLYTATPPTNELVDLARLVEEELQQHVPDAVVHTRLDQGVVVRASRIRLARVLANLVANAERHATSTIEIIVAAEPPDAVLEVIDDGPGVAPDEREKIFRRRYRAEESRRLDSGGSGLGLPIAREIAQGYGGDLYLADHPSGARFVMRLPLAV